MQGRKPMLPKSNNIAKRPEGCSKSHFSHIRNNVEKVTPYFGGGFGTEIDPRSRQSGFEKVTKNQIDF